MRDPETRPRMASRRTWTDQQIIDALRLWAERRGRPPVFGDLQTPRGYERCAEYPTPGVVAYHFGTWRKGLAAAGVKPERRPPWADAFDAQRARLEQGST